MGNYYKDKQRMHQELQRIFSEKKGQWVDISQLRLTFATKFGFGKSQIMEALEVYDQEDVINIDKSSIYIKSKVEVKDEKEVQE